MNVMLTLCCDWWWQNINNLTPSTKQYWKIIQVMWCDESEFIFLGVFNFFSSASWVSFGWWWVSFWWCLEFNLVLSLFYWCLWVSLCLYLVFLFACVGFLYVAVEVFRCVEFPCDSVLSLIWLMSWIYFIGALSNFVFVSCASFCCRNEFLLLESWV